MKSRTSLITISVALLTTTACVGTPDDAAPEANRASGAQGGASLGEHPAGEIDWTTETGASAGNPGGSGGVGGNSGAGGSGSASGEGGKSSTGGSGGEPATGGTGATSGGEPEADLSDILFPPYPDLDQLALPELVRSGNLVGLLETTLQSPGDTVTLEIGGDLDVPVVPGLGVGGKVAIAFSVNRQADEDGTTLFLLEGGAEVGAAANVSAGILGASLTGTRGFGVRWRFDTQAEVVMAIQRLVVLHVITWRLEAAATMLHGRLGALEGALSEARRRRQELVDWFFDRLGLETELLERIRRLQEEHAVVRRGLERLDELTGWVVDARGFLMSHFAGIKAELGTERKVSLGLTAFETGGDTSAIVGFQGSYAIERSVIVEVGPLGASPGATAGITLCFRRNGAVAGGVKEVGIAAEFERRIEISAGGSITTEGVHIDSTKPNAVLSVDRSYHGTIGVGLAGRYGLGRKSSVGIRLGALASLGTQALATLVTGGPEDAAATLARLPITFEGQARIERGLMIGIGGEVGKDWLGGKVYAEAVWADAGAPIAVTRPASAETLLELTSLSAEDAIPEADFELLDRIGEQVVGLQGAF